MPPLGIEVTYALIAHPTQAMRRIRSTGAVGTSVMMLVAGSISLAVSYLFITTASTGPKGVVVVALFTSLTIATVIVLWLLLGGLTHASACLMGGYGHFGKFLSAYGVAAAPFTLCVPAILLLSLLGSVGMLLFVVPVLPILLLWWWVLTITGIKEMYGLSAGTATVASLLPYVLMIAVLVLVNITSLFLLGLQWGF